MFFLPTEILQHEAPVYQSGIPSGREQFTESRNKLIVKFKLAGAPLLLSISGKDADDGHKDDGTYHVVMFTVSLGADGCHCWPVVCMQMPDFC